MLRRRMAGGRVRPSKPLHRWEASTYSPGVGCVHPDFRMCTLPAISWFLARQQAAVQLHADPDDITVRLAPVA